MKFFPGRPDLDAVVQRVLSEVDGFSASEVKRAWVVFFKNINIQREVFDLSAPRLEEGQRQKKAKKVGQRVKNVSLTEVVLPCGD